MENLRPICPRHAVLERLYMTQIDKPGERRRAPSDRTVRAVWAAAAGRCTFCNRSCLENEELGLAVPFGELAHNVGWGDDSPRGESELTPEQRASAENLLLLCRNCHKPIDDDGVIGFYDSERLLTLKNEHEARIRVLTEIDGSRKACILRVVGDVRNVPPALTYDAVLSATAAVGLFPTRLPDAYRNAEEADLRGLAGEGTSQYYAAAVGKLDQLTRRVAAGIAMGEISRLAVFGWARIPLLIHLGAQLDDKIETFIFQRQRIDDRNAWKWPVVEGAAPDFEYTRIREGDRTSVALVLNLSGTIRIDELPAEVADHAVYAVEPVAPFEPGHSLISSPLALFNFDGTMRRFLATIERVHGKLPAIAVFPAVPVSAAVTVGRTLMPNVSPHLVVYDRNEAGEFVLALEVAR